MNNQPALLKISGFQKRCGLSRATLQRLLRAKIIKGIGGGSRTTFIPMSELNRLMGTTADGTASQSIN